MLQWKYLHLPFPKNICAVFVVCSFVLFFFTCSRFFFFAVPGCWVWFTVVVSETCRGSYLTFCNVKRPTIGWIQRTDYGRAGINLQLFDWWQLSSMKSWSRPSEVIDRSTIPFFSEVNQTVMKLHLTLKGKRKVWRKRRVKQKPFP